MHVFKRFNLNTCVRQTPVQYEGMLSHITCSIAFGFGIASIATFCVKSFLNHDQPYGNGVGNRSTLVEESTNPKVTSNSLTCYMSELLQIEKDSGELLNVFIESRINEKLPRLDICDDKDSKHVYVVKIIMPPKCSLISEAE